jgi:1-pyrroline-5-carboxylate dehydrogenase
MSEPRDSEPGNSEPGNSEPGKGEPREGEPRENEPRENEPRKTEPRQSESRESEQPESEQRESEPQRITYTSTGSSDAFHERFEQAAAEVRERLGQVDASLGGGFRDAASFPGPERASLAETRSPTDSRLVVSRVHQAGGEEVAAAVARAQAAFPRWRGLGWQARVAMLRQAAGRLAERKYELAALMVYEVGKNRLEAMGEVEESADLLRYYAAAMEEASGYARPMARASAGEATQSIFLPYGVFGVIAPFNFPLALAAGMIGAALVTGNTVVFKPPEEAPLVGAELCQALWEAGVPREALLFVPGSGEEAGRSLVEHPLTQGVAFTGSHEVGMRIYRGFSRAYPKPAVVEMGGKNPAIVTASADLEAAAEGVMRSAFGFGGQKCSACSRVYVVEAVAAPFLARLVEATAALRVGNPLAPLAEGGRDVFLGPLISAAAVEKHQVYVERIRAAGGEILIGGGLRRDGELAHGHYVEPAVATLANKNSYLFFEEMFVPILLVAAVGGLEEAVELSNRAHYGLTAGLFSRDPREVDAFLDGIEAGVTYVNRRSGATTGAWPGVNPFGGWKGSGSTGPAALGPYYLLKFMHEQSRTVSGVDG